MVKPPFQARELVDFFFAFPKGVNAGIAPILLPKDQLASAVNVTLRGDFPQPRPRFRRIALDYVGYEGLTAQADFENGRFQGACYFNPDAGTDSLMASISGHLFRLAISGNTATVTDESIPADLDDPTAEIAWMIQAEKWVIKTDGTTKPPLFYDGVSSVRSNGNTSISYSAKSQTQFSIPAVGAQVVNTAGTQDITLSIAFTGQVGDVINFKSAGGFTVTKITGFNVQLTNLNAHPIGGTIRVNATATDNVTWTSTGNELPAGRNLVYGLGRVWMALTDAKQFIASDLVGGSSGTLANNFRDSVKNVTENNYLLGGGNFAVPGSYGDIHALCFSETLDTSLGQGALQILTQNLTFSCNAPVDRTTWQSLTNPILTESAKNSGGLSQWSTINANSDILSRDVRGIRSLILSRREFNTWGNTPISREVQPQIERDSEDLLRFSSAVEFDNRFLLTSEGVLTEGRGVYWKRIIPINFDPVSSLGGKAPSIYDSLYWTGLNIFQLVKGIFGNTERCFAFTLNNFTGKIELWEILKSSDPAIYDNDVRRVTWSIDAFLDFDQKNPQAHERLRLDNGEIIVDELQGTVDFQAYYRPDDWPCWVPWFAWTECNKNDQPGDVPSFRPNMGLGEPKPPTKDANGVWQFCDPINNRPLREGYTFHFKLVVTGQCRIKGARFGAVSVPQPEWAKQLCPCRVTPTGAPFGNNQIPVNAVVIGDVESSIVGDQGGVLLGG